MSPQGGLPERCEVSYAVGEHAERYSCRLCAAPTVVRGPGGLAEPIIAGWMHYYGRFYRSGLYPLLLRVSFYLRRWAGRKYKRLRTYRRFKRWWTGLFERQPSLFAHWQWVRAY